jgi:hypothetical protein
VVHALHQPRIRVARLSQIQEWREWLQNNLDQARRPPEQDGLGLLDIRPRAEGLVLVGRRDQIRPTASALRQQLWERDGIRMHTYDWLLEQLDGVRRFVGPAGVNPYVLLRESPADALDDLFSLRRMS